MENGLIQFSNEDIHYIFERFIMNWPNWLSPISSQINNTSHPQYEVSLDWDDISMYPHESPKVIVWTPSKLRAKKKALLRKIEKEKAIQLEIESLREECVELGVTLSRLVANRTSRSFPKSVTKISL